MVPVRPGSPRGQGPPLSVLRFLPNLGYNHANFGESEGGCSWAGAPPPPPQALQGSPVWLALSGHWLHGRGSWKELKKYHITQAMMVL